MASREWPEAVQRLIDRWLERHERTGIIPARVRYRSRTDGRELWCSLADAGPDELQEVRLYHCRQALDLLHEYRGRPTPELAQHIANSAIAAAVAEALQGDALQGEPEEGT
jgi:hypothetical protein